MVQETHILFCSLIQNKYFISVSVASVFTPKVSSILANLENSMSLTREDHHNYTMNFKRARVIQRDHLLKSDILKDSWTLLNKRKHFNNKKRCLVHKHWRCGAQLTRFKNVFRVVRYAQYFIFHVSTKAKCKRLGALGHPATLEARGKTTW